MTTQEAHQWDCLIGRTVISVDATYSNKVALTLDDGSTAVIEIFQDYDDVSFEVAIKDG